MRTIDSNMQTALAATTRRPAVTLSVQDHIQHLATYQTPSGSDAYHDACIANDNSIIRAYVSRGGNSFDRTVYYQRITDPSVAGQWTTWTALTGGSGNIFQDGGVAVSNNSGTLRIFAQQGTGGNALWNWTSTNNGATWSGQGTVCTPAGGALIKGISSAGNNDVFFLYDVMGGEAMGACFYTNAWSAIHTWSFSPISGSGGLAAIFVPGHAPTPPDQYYIVQSNGYSLSLTGYIPGTDLWVGYGDGSVAPATSTAVARIGPRMSVADGLYSLICMEIDSGALTGSVYSYPRVRQSRDLIHWSDGFILHTLSSNYGAEYFKLTAPQTGNSGARYYAFTMAKVLSDTVYAQGNSSRYLDLSNAILSYKRIENIAKPSHFEVVLDNAGGALNSLVSTGSAPYKPIGPSTSLVLSEGYMTGSPPTTPDVIQTGTYHVTGIQFNRTPEENSITLTAYDLSRNLDLIVRWQNSWTNQTLSWLILEICARAGVFNALVPNTTQTTQTIATFIMHAGETYRKALDELCATYGLAYFMNESENLIFRELSGSDTSVWTYQPEIEVVAFGTTEVRANHVIVNGKPPKGGAVGSLTVGEAYDDAAIQSVQVERIYHHVDQKLTSTTQCGLKANFILAQQQRAQTHHQVIVPLNPALQLLDVVTLTDSVAPTGSGQTGNSRIVQVTDDFDAQKAAYDLHLVLEGV